MSSGLYRVGTRRVCVNLEGGPKQWRASVDGHELEPVVVRAGDRYVEVTVGQRRLRLLYARCEGRIHVVAGGQLYVFEPAEDSAGESEREDGGAFTSEIVSPMPGKVLDVLVREGEEVTAGQPLVMLEAMKMEQALAAPQRARVRRIVVTPGQKVGPGQALVELEPAG